MEIGKLNQRITILENRTVVDEIGNHTSKWDEVFSCWAKVGVKKLCRTSEYGSHQRNTVRVIPCPAEFLSAVFERHNTQDSVPWTDI